ncbi:MAG: class I SAM-dependent methyltransferase [Gemmatimonadales bacterium]
MGGILSPAKLRELLGDIDIYLLDQVLKGRLSRSSRVLDAGCGGGRNVTYPLKLGCEVFAIDSSPGAIAEIRSLAARLRPELPESNFRLGNVCALPFPAGRFDVIISNAVLHFAADENEFRTMLVEMWRVLAHGGVFFARLASTIGIEGLVVPIGGRRWRIPDGSERFLVDEQMLHDYTDELGGTLLEPIKTVNVQNERCMTTWCMTKNDRNAPVVGQQMIKEP